MSRRLGGLAAACAALTLAMADTALAQFHDQPASPRSLPADNLPPFGMLGADGQLIPQPALPAGGVHRGPGSPPESTARGPSLDQAIMAGRAAVRAPALGPAKARATSALRMATNTWLPSDPSAVSMARASPAVSITVLPTR